LIATGMESALEVVTSSFITSVARKALLVMRNFIIAINAMMSYNKETRELVVMWTQLHLQEALLDLPNKELEMGVAFLLKVVPIL